MISAWIWRQVVFYHSSYIFSDRFCQHWNDLCWCQHSASGMAQHPEKIESYEYNVWKAVMLSDWHLTKQEKGRKAEPHHSIKLYALQIYFLVHLVCLSMLTWNCCKQHCKQAKCCLQFISDKHKHCIIPVESNFNFTFKYLLNQPPCNVLWWVINTFEKTNLLSIASI